MLSLAAASKQRGTADHSSPTWASSHQHPDANLGEDFDVFGPDCPGSVPLPVISSSSRSPHGKDQVSSRSASSGALVTLDQGSSSSTVLSKSTAPPPAAAVDGDLLAAPSRRLLAPVPEEIPSSSSTPWYDYPPGEFTLETAAATPTSSSSESEDGSSYDYPPEGSYDYPSGDTDYPSGDTDYPSGDTDYTPAPPGSPPGQTDDSTDGEWSTYSDGEDGDNQDPDPDPPPPPSKAPPSPSKAPPTPTSGPPSDYPSDYPSDESGGSYDGGEDPPAESPYGGAPLPPDTAPGKPTAAIPGFAAGTNPVFSPPGAYASLPTPAKGVNITALKEKAQQELYNATGIIKKIVTTVSAKCRGSTVIACDTVLHHLKEHSGQVQM